MCSCRGSAEQAQPRALVGALGLRAHRLPAALVQGQRDCFGAHTYQRVDRDDTFRTLWGEDGREEER
ncbi:hypothetical protein A6A07_31490 [Streptomyces sp. CB03911]|nr:hypothetical protein A6A07_31490 [Streptomyces sp. CB03911]